MSLDYLFINNSAFITKMLNHFKCETHEMSFQFIPRVSSWQSVERIIGLSGLPICKTRQKCKKKSLLQMLDWCNGFNDLHTIVCILRNGWYFWKLTRLIRFHPVPLDFAAEYNHFYHMNCRIQASASLLSLPWHCYWTCEPVGSCWMKCTIQIIKIFIH